MYTCIVQKLVSLMLWISLHETNVVHKFVVDINIQVRYFGDEMEQRMRQDVSPQSQKASRIPAYLVL